MKKANTTQIERRRSSLPYADSTLGPMIEIPDIGNFKKDKGNRAKQHFTSRAIELQRMYDELVDEIQINKLLFEVEYKFIPVVGKTYFLYHRGYEDTMFLSIIPPNEWDFEFIGAFRFCSNDVWEKVDYEW